MSLYRLRHPLFCFYLTPKKEPSMRQHTRVLSLFLCLCLVLPVFTVFAEGGSLPTLVFDSKEYVGEAAELPYFYVVEDGGATLTDALDSLCGDAILPDTLGGYPLTKIASGAFANLDTLHSVTVPAKVDVIESGAFDSTVTERKRETYDKAVD